MRKNSGGGGGGGGGGCLDLVVDPMENRQSNS